MHRLIVSYDMRYLIAASQEVNNLESSVVVQELVFIVL